MVDPFRDCKKIFDMHFRQRMDQRHLPLDQVHNIVENGTRSPEGKGRYSVRLGRWTIKLTTFKCTLFLGSAILD